MDHDLLAALVFCCAAGAGQILHALKKWSEGDATPLGWFSTNPRRTVGAIIGNGMGMLVFIQTGVLGPIASQPNGWFALCLFGLMNGWTTDSGLNKATRAAWTTEERAANQTTGATP